MCFLLPGVRISDIVHRQLVMYYSHYLLTRHRRPMLRLSLVFPSAFSEESQAGGRSPSCVRTSKQRTYERTEAKRRRAAALQRKAPCSENEHGAPETPTSESRAAHAFGPITPIGSYTGRYENHGRRAMRGAGGVSAAPTKAGGGDRRATHAFGPIRPIGPYRS